MQSSEATHNEAEQVKQLADQVRSAMVEKEKLQEELDGYKGKISNLEMEVARGNDDLSARAKDLESLHTEIATLKASAASQQEKYESDVKGVKARLADIMTENMDLKEKVLFFFFFFFFLLFFLSSNFLNHYFVFFFLGNSIGHFFREGVEYIQRRCRNGGLSHSTSGESQETP